MRLQVPRAQIQPGGEGAIVSTYKTVRMYFDKRYRKHTIATGLTLEEAQAHCRDPETSSKTCKLARNVCRTEKRGPWFDGYEGCNHE